MKISNQSLGNLILIQAMQNKINLIAIAISFFVLKFFDHKSMELESNQELFINRSAKVGMLTLLPMLFMTPFINSSMIFAIVFYVLFGMECILMFSIAIAATISHLKINIPLFNNN